MATQRALLVQEVGKPLVLVHDRLIPEPGRGQLQIKVTVAGESDMAEIDCIHRFVIWELRPTDTGQQGSTHTTKGAETQVCSLLTNCLLFSARTLSES
jgi:hypothetical protein